MKKELALMLFVLSSLPCSLLHGASPAQSYCPAWDSNAFVYDTSDGYTLSIMRFCEENNRTSLLSLNTLALDATTPGETFETLMRQSHRNERPFCFILYENENGEKTFLPTNSNLSPEKTTVPSLRGWKALRKYRLHPLGRGEFYDPTPLVSVTFAPSTTVSGASHTSLTSAAALEKVPRTTVTVPAPLHQSPKATLHSPERLSASTHEAVASLTPAPTPHINAKKTESLRSLPLTMMTAKALTPPPASSQSVEENTQAVPSAPTTLPTPLDALQKTPSSLLATPTPAPVSTPLPAPLPNEDSAPRTTNSPTLANITPLASAPRPMTRVIRILRRGEKDEVTPHVPQASITLSPLTSLATPLEKRKPKKYSVRSPHYLPAIAEVDEDALAREEYIQKEEERKKQEAKLHARRAALEQEKRVQEAREAELKAAQEAEAKEKERLRTLEAAQKVQQQAALEQEKRAQEAKEAELKAAKEERARKEQRERESAKKAKDDAKKAVAAKKSAAAAKEAALLEQAATQATAAKAALAARSTSATSNSSEKTKKETESTNHSDAAAHINLHEVITRALAEGRKEDAKELLDSLGETLVDISFFIDIHVNHPGLLTSDQLKRLLNKACRLARKGKPNQPDTDTYFLLCYKIALSSTNPDIKLEFLDKCDALKPGTFNTIIATLRYRVLLAQHDSTHSACTEKCIHVEAFRGLFTIKKYNGVRFSSDLVFLEAYLLIKASQPESCQGLKRMMESTKINPKEALIQLYTPTASRPHLPASILRALNALIPADMIPLEQRIQPGE